MFATLPELHLSPVFANLLHLQMVKRSARIGKKRPWRILPAPPPRDWFEVLEELPSDFGLELAMLVRHLRLASECPADVRPKLFSENTARHVGERRTEAIHGAPASLRSPLRVLMRLTGRRPPEDVEAARACEEIATWAQDAGYSKTALHFAEAGAAIRPEDPYFAFVAGRMNRIMGEPWRAEVFYSRSIRYAHRQQNWDVYVRAHLGFGRLFAARGRTRAAATHYSTAARVALDQGHDWLAAQTYHDLLVLYFEQEDLERAAKYAKLAIATYPRHHERFPIAVHDFAILLIIGRHYNEALRLLEKLSKAPLRPYDQVLVAGTLARTVGNLGMGDKYADAEARVLSLAPHYEDHAAAAFINLAFGARALGDWELAEQYAEKGITLGEARQEHHVVRVGRELLKELKERTPLLPPAPPLLGEPAKQLNDFAKEVDAQLGAWRSETWTKKQEQYGLWVLGPV